jgi:pre-rRNA-processing protein IPI3
LFFKRPCFSVLISPIAMLLREIVLCATAPTASAGGPGLIAVHDIQTGATLASFKQTNAGPHSVAVLESKNSQGGIMLASQPEKAILNVYNFQKVLSSHTL